MNSNILDIDDDHKLYSKYLNKCNNAKLEGLRCLLTFDEFCDLVREAGLTSSMLGFSGQGYVLARFNDIGDYTVNNCRFITQKENAKEKKISESSREASRRNIQKARAINETLTKEELSNRIVNSDKWKRYVNIRREKARIRQRELDEHKNKSYTGVKNSQYGTFWITDGKHNKKWRTELGNIPDGWKRGRVI